MAKKQKSLPGMEPESIKEIDDAAEAYVKERDKRVRQTVREVDAKTALIDVMKKNKVSVYKDRNCTPPLVVTLSDGKTAVKVVEDEEPGKPKSKKTKGDADWNDDDDAIPQKDQ